MWTAAYDSLGRRSATVSHTGAVTRYEYNPAGQLAKVYYPDSPELRDLQEKEARQHGLLWQEGVSGLSNGHLSTGEYTELSRLLVRMRHGGGFLPATQVFRTEMYTYDANGNRATKTTAYGTITYTYDAENRLVSSGANGRVAVTYRYDSNGNLLSQTSSLKHSIYEYSPQNRMVRARVVDDEARTIASTRYGYDPLGRRALVQDNGITTLRTLYDGLGFDVVKESPVYANGGFTDTYNTSIQHTPAGYATGERYRYLDDGATATSEKYQYIEDNAYQTVSSRYAGERTMLYAHGSPVAINRSSGTRGYLGTDILGSTRSITDNHGVQESYYDYDIFGSPIAGDFTTGADYGYLGKPYDSTTGLYNYGYRDYSPQTVRFTTVDPIRDGANWFAYVNNDPVNYVDLWGLFSTELQAAIDNHIGETYVLGVNDCDIWVEKVVKEANPNSTLDTDWGRAKETTAHGHKEKLSGKLTDSMENHGDYIAIQEKDNRGVHVMLVSYNEDGTVDLAHNTSNPENGVTPDGKGYSEKLQYKSKDDFDNNGWGKVSYYSLEEKKNK